MKKYIFIMICTMLFIIFCMGFIYTENNENDAEKKADTITYGINKIPRNLKSITNLTSRETDIICALSKGLISKDDKNNIAPVLCKRVIVSNDKIQYKFEIKDDIYWSDNSRITANDIVTFFKDLLKEEDSENIKALLNVYGARQFREGKVTFMSGVAIKAEDNCVIMRLNSPCDNFLDELTKPQYRIRKNLILWDDMYKNYNNLIYSGDYVISQIYKDNLVMQRIHSNNNKINNIDIVKNENDELAMAAFEIKERNMVVNPPESELLRYSRKNKLITFPTSKAVFVYINSKDGQISLEEKKFIYKNMYKAIKESNDNSKQYDIAECSYFREEQKNLNLIQSRKVNMNSDLKIKKPEILTIIAEDTSENRYLCKMIQYWFKKNLKITVKCSFVKEEMNDTELRNRYDMVFINTKSDYNNKKQTYCNFEQYLSDEEKRLLNNENDAYLFEETLFNNYDILPLVFYNENIVIDDEVSRLNIDGNGNIDFSRLR